MSVNLLLADYTVQVWHYCMCFRWRYMHKRAHRGWQNSGRVTPGTV